MAKKLKVWLNKSPFKTSGNSWREGGHQRPPGTEDPGGWGGVQIKKSSVGGGSMDIFWNHTIYE